MIDMSCSLFVSRHTHNNHHPPSERHDCGRTASEDTQKSVSVPRPTVPRDFRDFIPKTSDFRNDINDYSNRIMQTRVFVSNSSPKSFFPSCLRRLVIADFALPTSTDMSVMPRPHLSNNAIL